MKRVVFIFKYSNVIEWQFMSKYFFDSRASHWKKVILNEWPRYRIRFATADIVRPVASSSSNSSAVNTTESSNIKSRSGKKLAKPSSKLRGAINDSQRKQEKKRVKCRDVSSSKRFPCANCDYVANRKYTVDIHHANIPKEIIKNKTCRICHQCYSHDGLRSHLRGYINTDRKIRGAHRNVSVEQHKMYLDAIKLRHL